MKPAALVLRPVLLTIVLVSLGGLPASAAEPAAADASTPSRTTPPDATEVLTHPETLATSSTFVCVPTYVATFTSRVHVRCSTAATVGSDTIWYWAVSSANQAEAARALSLFLTAKATGKNLRIYYTGTDTSGNSIGCYVGDCRLAWGIELMP